MSHGQQVLVQIFTQFICRNTDLSKPCEESVHHRRLPMDRIANTVTFGHSATEKHNGLKQKALGDTVSARCHQRLAAPPGTQRLITPQVLLCLYHESAGKRTRQETRFGGQPGCHVTHAERHQWTFASASVTWSPPPRNGPHELSCLTVASWGQYDEHLLGDGPWQGLRPASPLLRGVPSAGSLQAWPDLPRLLLQPAASCASPGHSGQVCPHPKDIPT